MGRSTVPDSPSIASGCATVLFDWLSDQIEDLESQSSRSDGNRGPRLIPEEAAPGRGGRLKIKPSYSLGVLEVDFAFVDECNGFVGLFKAYNTPSWGEALLADLHLAAIVRQEQLLKSLAKDESPRHSHRPERAWTVYLFALVPSEGGPDEAEEQLREVWQDIREGRLIEEIGLSLLRCCDDVLNDLKAGPRSLEVQRFLAPLLLRVREWEAHSENRLDDWRRMLLEKLGTVGGELGYSTRVSEWVRGRIVARVEPLLRLGTVNARLTLGSLKNVRLRRFAHKKCTSLDFKELTLVYGHNGSGKSTLLEAVELALTGRLDRFERFADMNYNGKAGLPDLYLRVLGSEQETPKGSQVDESWGELEVMREDPVAHTKGGYGKTSSLPVRYLSRSASELFPDDAADCPITSMNSFYLRQGEIRRFVEMSPDERYSWMVELLGVPAESIGRALDDLHKEVRSSADDRWRKITGKRIPANAKALAKSFTEEVGKLLDHVAKLVGPLEELSCEPKHFSMGQPGVNADLIGGFRSLGKLPGGSPEVNKTVQEIRSILNRSLWSSTEGEDTRTAAALLRRLMEQCQTLVDLIEATYAKWKESCDRVEGAMRVAQKQIDQYERMDQETDYRATLGDLEELRGRLSSVRNAQKGIDTALGLINSLEKAVKFSAGLERQLAAFSVEDLSRLNWAGQPSDWQVRILEMQDVLEAVRPHVAALASLHDLGETHRRYLEGARRQLEDAESDLLSRMRAIRSLSDADQGDGDADELWEEHLAAILDFADQIGMSVTRDSVDSPEVLKSIVKAFESLFESVEQLESAAQVLRDLGSDERIEALASELEKWNELGDDWESCGCGPLLSLLDQVARQRDLVHMTVRTAVQELLEAQVVDLWRELVWAFTAYSWYQPSPYLVVQHSRTNSITEVETDYGPAALVFNVAEQSIAGLAWFFTSYLLAGRWQSSAIILDDPFQNLDDVNLSAFVRIFDDVLRVLGAQQIVIALHQPSIYEYLRMEFAESTRSGRSSAGSKAKDGKADFRGAVALWKVEATGSDSSEVTCEVLQARRPARRFFDLAVGSGRAAG